MDEVEGAGILNLGVGALAVGACGKTSIANMITKPYRGGAGVFDEQDENVFSRGHVDVFFDKCY